MENSKFDLSSLTKYLENLVQDIDIESLKDFKNSIDKEKVIKESTGLLDKLKGSLPPEDQQTISNIIEGLIPNKSEE